MTTTTAPELVQLDPATLVIGANARIEVQLPESFVQDIAEHGVMQPILATRDEDNTVTVLMGQRRTLAARQAGLDTVPVVIVPEVADDAERIVRQVAENDSRADMTGTDRVHYTGQMALMGFTADQIASKTRRPRVEVEAALSVAASPASRQMMEQEGMDLETAAAFAEFEGDEDATQRIAQAIRYGNSIAHTVARIRQDRHRAELIAQSSAEREAQGVRVIPRPSHWYGYGTRPDTLPLSALIDKEGRGWEDRADAHRQVCTGHVEWIEADDDAAHITAGCENWRSHGHKVPTTSGAPRQSAEERRAVIEGNRAWLAAAEVRREFVQGIAKGAKLPKGAERITTEAIAFGRITGVRGWYDLRGAKAPELWAGHIDQKAAARALSRLSVAKLALANLTMALAYSEAQAADKGAWRRKSETVANYLTALQGWGYQLSEAEATYLSEQTPETADVEDENDE